MRDRELEKNLKSIPVKKMRAGFRSSLLERLKEEARPAQAPYHASPGLVPAFNFVMIVLIAVLVIALYVSPSWPPSQALTGAGNTAIIETGQGLYSKEGLAFRANVVKTEHCGLVSLKEAGL
ncbi:MAG: hypothetical protein M1269_04805 [Chloroflexi bacterium]|nr:hypothetical protein [Chloroflexota bacterium]